VLNESIRTPQFESSKAQALEDLGVAPPNSNLKLGRNPKLKQISTSMLKQEKDQLLMHLEVPSKPLPAYGLFSPTKDIKILLNKGGN
jgi:hypothetical protein